MTVVGNERGSSSSRENQTSKKLEEEIVREASVFRIAFLRACVPLLRSCVVSCLVVEGKLPHERKV